MPFKIFVIQEGYKLLKDNEVEEQRAWLFLGGVPGERSFPNPSFWLP